MQGGLWLGRGIDYSTVVLVVGRPEGLERLLLPVEVVQQAWVPAQADKKAGNRKLDTGEHRLMDSCWDIE